MGIFKNDWDFILKEEMEEAYFKELMDKLDKEYQEYKVYPRREDLFKALILTAYEDCQIVFLGQDPYHGPGQANGLAFSVNKGIKLPPSLRNIYKEISDDLGLDTSQWDGDLTAWAKKGILLLNASLSVREGEANSHKYLNWYRFTDRIIEILSDKGSIIFILLGNFARAKKKLIDEDKNYIIEAAHPSPLSAYRGFFGSKVFSQASKILEAKWTEEGYQSDLPAEKIWLP